MKALHTILLITIGLAIGSSASAMKATADIFQFRAADKPYVEIFFYVVGRSIKQSGTSESSVQVTYYIEQDSVVLAGDKYNLVAKRDGEISDFMDLRRHYLAPGQYVFKARIQDNQNPEDVVVLSSELIVPEISKVKYFSDLQLLSNARSAWEQDKWVKNGVTCIPLPYMLYQEGMDILRVYTELYNIDNIAGGDFYVKYSIKAPGDSEIEILKVHKRLSPKAIIPLVQSIDISGLSSGKYVLTASAFTRHHVLIDERSVEFNRNNPKADLELLQNFDKYYEYSFTKNLDEDSLRYALKSIAAKVATAQVDVLNYLIKKGGIEEQRKFLHQFWLEMNDTDPEPAYKEHMLVADQVDVMFKSGMGHGFETDRGYIFMRYGAPNNTIAVDDEPSAPPYEIWIYFQFPATGASDVKFLFYSPELANSYTLLHSNCELELNNPAWEQMLYRDAVSESGSGDFIDAQPVSDGFGRRAKEYFTDF